MTMDRLTALMGYLSNPDNWCRPEDRTFYTWYLILTSSMSYIMLGLYLHYPDILDMVFWPLNIYR